MLNISSSTQFPSISLGASWMGRPQPATRAQHGTFQAIAGPTAPSARQRKHRATEMTSVSGTCRELLGEPRAVQLTGAGDVVPVAIDGITTLQESFFVTSNGHELGRNG